MSESRSAAASAPGASLNMNEDELELCGRSCRLLYREIGIGSALTYLFFRWKKWL